MSLSNIKCLYRKQCDIIWIITFKYMIIYSALALNLTLNYSMKLAYYGLKALLNFKMLIKDYFFANLNSTYANREYAFASIGDGLNDTEAANFYTAVQTFQTTLGRNV